ncbi:hypothetical protein MNBD_NITROSPINAE02-1076 [hydrothermal vent metagenome]|uniref:Uncharacterized protein n=1 Tax=hydrothermal vent metagenome TaxID=652676 RepID=A0A3B1CHU5_9ZZZZ
MSETLLNGEVRKVGRKGPARRLRANGFLPGIVYGQGDNVAVTVTSRDVLKILEQRGGTNKIISTKFEGDNKERHVMIKYLDFHPISDLLLHIDLLEIDIRKPVRIVVAIEFTGVAKGVKEQGGQLFTSLLKLNIECMPNDIPDVITVQVDEMVTGEVKQVKDLDIPPRVTVLDNPDERVVTVAEPKVEADSVAEGEEGEAEGAGEAKPDEKADSKPDGK